MAKKKNIEVEPEDLVAAQTGALAEELVEVQARLDAEIDNRLALEQQIHDLRTSVTQVTNSVQIAPPPPAPLERPVITTADGRTLRFKGGAFFLKGKRVLAADVAADAALLAEVVKNFPGLFVQAD